MTLLCSTAMMAVSYAQQAIGTVDELMKSLDPGSGNSRIGLHSIQASDRTLSLKINVNLSEAQGRYIIGSVPGSPVSTVYLRFAEGKLEGKAILAKEKKAYEYYSKGETVYVKELDINKVICVDYSRPASAAKANAVQAIPPPTSTVYQLQSFPAASAVVYLDFDGEYVVSSEWNGGNPIDATPINFTEAEITEIFNYISEDFRPFNINVTTSEAVYFAAPINTRQRVIYTTNDIAAPGWGGVAQYNSFVSGRNTPCWVYLGGAKNGAEAGSHEVGHTLGLSHDGQDAPGQAHVEYYGGHGDWAPIMGVGYSRPLVQWSRGEYDYANNPEDDIQIIAGGSNGFTFRKDEAGGTAATANQLVYATNGSVSAASNSGVISNRSDVDSYYFTTSGGNVTFTVNPASTQTNLDILITLTNSAGTVVATSNPANSYGASISTSLTAGKYYLNVDGTGSGNPANTGYSDYASIGGYSISGSFPATAYNPAPVVAFIAPLELDTVATGAAITLNASASDNGSITKVEFYEGSVLLSSDASAPYSASYTPTSGYHELRAIATDNAGATTTASITIFARNPAVVATVYQHCDFSTEGYVVGLREGNYRLSQLVNLGVNNDDISSLTISAGYEMLVYRDENFLGPFYTLSGAYSCLASENINDWISSLIIRKVNTTLPSVTITSPTNGQSFNQGANIVFSATATDPDGTIASVQFFNGSTLLFTDNAAPYTYTIANVAAGNYTLTATATDNGGNSASSTVAISVVVQPTTPGISGPACVVPGQTYTYTLYPGTATPTGVNWFASSGNVQVDAVNRNKAYFTPASGTSSAVIRAGANFGSAPWYQEFQFTATVGGCSNAAATLNEGAPSLITTSPFTSETALFTNNGDNITAVRVYDGQGMEVENHQGLTRPEFTLGQQLKPGFYVLYIETEATVFKKVVVKSE